MPLALCGRDVPMLSFEDFFPASCVIKHGSDQPRRLPSAWQVTDQHAVRQVVVTGFDVRWTVTMRLVRAQLLRIGRRRMLTASLFQVTPPAC